LTTTYTLNSIAISLNTALSHARELPDISERTFILDVLTRAVREVEIYERALKRRDAEVGR
jgi:hypothetical protein